MYLSTVFRWIAFTYVQVTLMYILKLPFLLQHVHDEIHQGYKQFEKRDMESGFNFPILE